MRSPDELVLVIQVGLEVARNGRRVAVLEAIIQGLVVGKVESLLLKLVLILGLGVSVYRLWFMVCDSVKSPLNLIPKTKFSSERVRRHTMQ